MAQQDENTIVDGWGSFPKGMNAGEEPQLLPKDQLANMNNGTVRGSFITNRPPYQILTIDYTLDFDGTGFFGGATYYKPDSGVEYIVAAIGGRLFRFDPQTNTVTATDITGGIVLPDGIPNWLWQSENYVINNDGTSVPRIYDGTNTRFANVQTLIATASAASTSVPSPGQSFILPVVAPYLGPVNIPVQIFQGTTSLGNFEIVAPGSSGSGFGVLLTNNSDTGGTEPAGAAVQILNSFNGLVNAQVLLASGAKNQILLDRAYIGSVGDKVTVKGLNEGTGAQITISPPIKAISADRLTITVTYNGPFGVLISKGAAITKANGGPPTLVGYLTGTINIPQGSTLNVTLDRPYVGPSQAVSINGFSYTIAQAPNVGGNSITLLNSTSSATVITTGALIYTLAEIPPGRMGAYIQGRNWICLPDGLSYIATDQVGDFSGTSALKYRDAVLQVTQNRLLSLGGAFRVPGGSGQITAMVDLATLDVSLGQGPVQVLTPNKVFSCAAPTIEDRAAWINVTNPIQTESLVAFGGLSQDSTIVVNGDLLFRSLDGERSLVLARREFNTWGNTPISNEVRPFLSADDPSLLQFSQAINFDNRMLLGASPVSGPQGTYWQNLVLINFDEISSLRGKAPSVWEGTWNGLNVIKFISGQFNSITRCFAFCQNTTTNLIELWEIYPSELPAGTLPLDNQTTPITWGCETPILLDTIQGGRGSKGKQHNDLCRLNSGEIYVKDLIGDTTFTVWFRPDYDVNWHQWYSWTVPKGATYQPRMGFGEPPMDPDQATGRPAREGYAFQFKIQITGSATVMGGRVFAEVVPTQTAADIFNPS